MTPARTVNAARLPVGAIVILPDGTIARAAPDGRLVPVVQGGHPHGEMGTEPTATRRAR